MSGHRFATCMAVAGIAFPTALLALDRIISGMVICNALGTLPW
jgi:hypothetical protein